MAGLKQVIVIPEYLGMSPGKVISQACHVVAAEAYVSELKPDCRIVLKCPTKKEISILWQRAWEGNKVQCRRFKDQAPTTENTAGKFTAYCFTGQAEDIDSLFGHLELY